MEVILFTVVGIALYLATGALLSLLEKMHGDPLPQRNVVFFIIILALSLPTFSVLRALLGDGESAYHDNEKQQATDGSNQPAEAH